MKREDVDRFEKLDGQVQSVYDEIEILSKKSPSDAVKKFKLKFINNLLKQGNELLCVEYRPFDDFSEFDKDEVPQNSDVAFILSQYLKCFEKLRADCVEFRYPHWCWVVEDKDNVEADEQGRVYIRTVMPKRLRQ